MMSLRTIVVTGLVVLASATHATAQLSKDQQKCLNAANKDGAAVAKTQAKESVACLKAAGKGTLGGTAQTCLTADVKDKVQKAKNKTAADVTKHCGTPPGFGLTSAATINAAAADGEVDLVADVFGANLDTAVQSCSSSKAACGCQQKVLKIVTQLADLKLVEFVKCKKTALGDGANSAAALAACVSDAGTPGSIAADSKSKLAKLAGGLGTAIAKSCDKPGVTATAFPGDCVGQSGTALATCLDQQVECRVCQIINAMDGLLVNCDLFDDGAANATCAAGSPIPTSTPPTPGPTPSAGLPSATPTSTTTPGLVPTPTATATFAPGSIFQGAISRTIGHWFYQSTHGQAGGTAECAARFPTSHLCTLAELQNAAGLGELVGAIDVDGLTVDHFWAVDAGATDLHQCITAPPGTLLRWAYATAHTASKGDFVTLNAATGTLGTLNSGGTPVSCNGSAFSVGCCN